MVEHRRGEETNEDFKKLLRRIFSRQTIEYATEKKRHKQENRPFRYPEFREEKREVNEEDEVGEIKLKGVLKEDVGECIETREDEENGEILKHVTILWRLLR